MKVLDNYRELMYASEPRAVALGNFDGIHLGHQALLHTMVRESGLQRLIPTVYTFKNHPGTVLVDRPNQVFPSKITPISLKIRIMEKMGVEMLFLDKFTKELMQMPPDIFARTILVDLLNAKLVVVGEDFRFGAKAKGDINMLKDLSVAHDFRLIVVPPVFDGNSKISSTQIRREIEKGNMEKVTRLLGRPFMMYNKVERGYGRGRTLGYPTANLILEEQQMVPAEGVYATCVRIDAKLYFGATSVGANPTFSAKKTTVETFIIDCDLMLYEREIELYFHKKIRDQITFQQVESLKKQIQQDVQVIKAYLQTKKTMIV
ncbi:bifunctional riboflavin kinase/FAD synthetase [Anoxynatronum buryatiense]|uniref:Riboflavin biosynthesis protein n=1 Tax=Anoxynatronum buryatiense TaxID=489973 RepID=A0AA45WUJ3_9CLOT|nr:bifunctional riboflavin kinase/FAD synthetase [Anoxynatronum buryatiense]SMP47680.1 FMN adenylyltransferase /riboflavin kinase [Anoxynatronum buryatiense]